MFIVHRPKRHSFPPGSTHRLCKLYGCWLLIALAQRVIEFLLHNLWSVQKKMTSVINPISRLSISECTWAGRWVVRHSVVPISVSRTGKYGGFFSSNTGTQSQDLNTELSWLRGPLLCLLWLLPALMLT